jgi:predicted DNA-binding antitoxin AbrB/MazE fold protein
MDLDTEAVYEQGTLRLPRALPLQQGQRVTVTIRAPEGQKTGSAVERLYGMLRWEGDPEDLDRLLNDPDEGQWGIRDGQ